MSQQARVHAHDRGQPGQAAQASSLAHPRSTLLVAIAGGVLFFCIALVSHSLPIEGASLWTTLIFSFFGLVSMTMAADYFIARHEVSEQGLRYARLGRRRSSMAWSDVTLLHYSPSMKWFRLEAANGEVARVSAMLVGLPEFARLVLAHVPAQAIDERTLSVLGDTADGISPKAWA